MVDEIVVQNKKYYICMLIEKNDYSCSYLVMDDDFKPFILKEYSENESVRMELCEYKVN